ncbi:hypothetical protein COP2_028382 [Malus domestica]
MEATDLVLSDRVLGPNTKSSQPCFSTSRARHRLVLQLYKVRTLLSLFLIVHISGAFGCWTQWKTKG